MDKEDGHRPWGYYEILSDRSDHKVKRVTVYPGKRLSLQRHARRAEHWFILNGEAMATLDHGDLPLMAGQSVDIPQGTAHRIMNRGTTDLIFIEVQTGLYFGEDDIERIEDDYGRV
jgi:mannose-6-phosphate isomerase-like protein (cupin superfamily)